MCVCAGDASHAAQTPAARPPGVDFRRRQRFGGGKRRRRPIIFVAGGRASNRSRAGGVSHEAGRPARPAVTAGPGPRRFRDSRAGPAPRRQVCVVCDAHTHKHQIHTHTHKHRRSASSGRSPTPTTTSSSRPRAGGSPPGRLGKRYIPKNRLQAFDCFSCPYLFVVLRPHEGGRRSASSARAGRALGVGRGGGKSTTSRLNWSKLDQSQLVKP